MAHHDHKCGDQSQIASLQYHWSALTLGGLVEWDKSNPTCVVQMRPNIERV